MGLKLQISQIFLPNSKQAQDYVSLYEEAVRTDTPAYLFLIIEIKGDAKNKATKNSKEFDKLTQAIARTLKQTYLHEEKLKPDTFEKALAHINQELSTLARKGNVKWYKKLNALVGVFAHDAFFVSVTGSATAYLLRGKSVSHITDQLSSGEKPHPLKTFVNFSSGGLTEKDTILLSTSNLYNYSSLEKIQTAFKGSDIASATKSLISDIKKDSGTGDAFATFFFQPVAKLPLSDEELRPLMAPVGSTIIEDAETFTRPASQKYKAALSSASKSFGGYITGAVKNGLRKLLMSRAPKRPESQTTASNEQPKKKNKTLYFYSFAAIFAVLIIALILQNFKNAESKTKAEVQAKIDSISTLISEAEDAQIYGDQEKAIQAISEAEQQFEELKNEQFYETEREDLATRLQKFSDQVNKVTRIENYESLATFANSPDRLAASPIGFSALNSFTSELQFYDAGEKTVGGLESLSQNKNFVAQTDSSSGKLIYLLADDGEIYSYDFQNSSLTSLTPSSTDSFGLPSGFNAFQFYLSRAYALLPDGDQILRYSPSSSGFQSPETWLTDNSDLSGALDIAIDGDVFVLFPDRLAKFTRGSLQSFSLQETSSKLEKAKAMLTGAGLEFIYILDPSNKRILVYNKSGQLATQLTSDEFNDLRDLWVDEVNKLLYLLKGNELIRFRF